VVGQGFVLKAKDYSKMKTTSKGKGKRLKACCRRIMPGFIMRCAVDRKPGAILASSKQLSKAGEIKRALSRDVPPTSAPQQRIS
jgi:hypothetical protein